MTMQELARYYLSQGKTVRAAALMMKLTKTEPTTENLTRGDQQHTLPALVHPGSIPQSSPCVRH